MTTAGSRPLRRCDCPTTAPTTANRMTPMALATTAVATGIHTAAWRIVVWNIPTP